jgi:hypothetical protein
MKKSRFTEAQIIADANAARIMDGRAKSKGGRFLQTACKLQGG